MTDYQAAHSNAVVALREDRVLLRAFGRDPVKMLQGLITNDIAGAPMNRAVYAAVLTPKGRMVADVRVWRAGEELVVDTAAGAADALMAHLKKYVPPLFARFEPGALHVAGVYGPRAQVLLGRVLGHEVHALQRDETVLCDDVLCIGNGDFGVPGYDLVAGEQRVQQLIAALQAEGAVTATHDALETLRIEAGTPAWGTELDERTIPLEAGLRRRAISETKGCYTGQEVIIRILHRGHVNWILRHALLGNSAPPAPGTEMTGENGRVAARITSATFSPREQQTLALGYVRREVEPGSTLTLQPEGTSATIRSLPGD